MDGSATHDTIKLLNGEAALELFAWIIMALVAVVSCVRKTHIGCISVFFLTLFTNTRLLRSLRRCPGSALRAEVFCAFHFIVELSVGAAACLSSQVRALHASWQDT